MSDKHNFSVGQIAKRCGVKVSALHFYERRGLIYSSRNSGNQRRYGADVLRRVSLIKAAQRLGISLAEIEQAFAQLPRHKAPSKADWESLSRHWHKQLDLRIQTLERLRDYLTGCIGCGCLSMKSCPLYNPEDVLGLTGTGPVILEGVETTE